MQKLKNKILENPINLGIFKVLSFILAYLGYQLVESLYTLTLDEPIGSLKIGMFLLTNGIWLVAGYRIIKTAMNSEKNNPAYVAIPKKDWVLRLSIWTIVAMLVTMAINIISISLLPKIGNSVNQADINQISHSDILNKSWITILTLIAAPIIEEFIFRFIPLWKVNNKKHAIVNLIISTALFATAHILSSLSSINLQTSTGILQLVAYILTYASTASVFALVYYKYRNIRFSIALHMLWNCISML